VIVIYKQLKLIVSYPALENIWQEAQKYKEKIKENPQGPWVEFFTDEKRAAEKRFYENVKLREW
jgi:hypothetical protein